MIDGNYLPHERRNFVHKRIFGAAKGFLGGGILGAVSGFAEGGGKRARVRLPTLSRAAPAPAPLPVRRPPPRTTTARPSTFSAAEKEAGRAAKFSVSIPSLPSSLPCVFPFRIDPRTGECRIFAGTQSGPDPVLPTTVSAPAGDAVMGRFGAALEPGSRIIDRAVCLRGMVLGVDNLCYNSKGFNNSNRMWPRGRRPLLTGGDMRAISTAAAAGRRLERTTKRLQKIGMMKKPARGPTRKQIAAEIHHANAK